MPAQSGPGSTTDRAGAGGAHILLPGRRVHDRRGARAPVPGRCVSRNPSPLAGSAPNITRTLRATRVHSPATGTVSCSSPAGPAQKHREIRARGWLSSRVGLEKTTFPRSHRGTGPIATRAMRLRVHRPRRAPSLVSRKLHFPEVTAAADQSQRALCACVFSGSGVLRPGRVALGWRCAGSEAAAHALPLSPGVLGQAGSLSPWGTLPRVHLCWFAYLGPHRGGSLGRLLAEFRDPVGC